MDLTRYGDHSADAAGSQTLMPIRLIFYGQGHPIPFAIINQ